MNPWSGLMSNCCHQTWSTLVTNFVASSKWVIFKICWRRFGVHNKLHQLLPDSAMWPYTCRMKTVFQRFSSPQEYQNISDLMTLLSGKFQQIVNNDILIFASRLESWGSSSIRNQRTCFPLYCRSDIFVWLILLTENLAQKSDVPFRYW